ncbi:hypothetical protein [uncultured Microbacterium sp.]|nr:hypothetical protein [uncultured Microbacterium sp.]
MSNLAPAAPVVPSCGLSAIDRDGLRVFTCALPTTDPAAVV